jgi:cell division protein FtsB
VKVDLGIWSKLTQAVVALVAIAALLLIGMTYLPLIQQNEQYRRRIDRLDADLEKQRQQARQLQAEFDALRSDPKTVERLAREKLGYARTNETVVYFEPATNKPAGR